MNENIEQAIRELALGNFVLVYDVDGREEEVVSRVGAFADVCDGRGGRPDQAGRWSADGPGDLGRPFRQLQSMGVGQSVQFSLSAAGHLVGRWANARR